MTCKGDVLSQMQEDKWDTNNISLELVFVTAKIMKKVQMWHGHMCKAVLLSVFILILILATSQSGGLEQIQRLAAGVFVDNSLGRRPECLGACYGSTLAMI